MYFVEFQIIHPFFDVTSGGWLDGGGGGGGGGRPVGNDRSKSCARANFSHIHFYTNFAAKITANRLS